jgi:tetratricopeptide (TPR) repeat protein
VNKKCEQLCLEKKDWSESIGFFKKAIKEEPEIYYLYSNLGYVYDAVLNDDENCVKYYKKAYQLDSTIFRVAINYNFALIQNGEFKASKQLMESKNFKSVLSKNIKIYDLYSSFYYHYFKKDYNKAQELLNQSLKGELLFDKINILAQQGKKDEVYKLLKNHPEMTTTDKAFIFASLKERDSMYFYLNKKDIISLQVNSRFEFDPYRKEERYKDFLKMNYLPITHWNE